MRGDFTLAILIKGSYEKCDSCKRSDKVNVIYAGNYYKDVNQMVLCDDCTTTLKNLLSNN